MTFEEFLMTTRLPSTAKEQLPQIISHKVKIKLMKREDAEEIIESVIEEINRVSIETVETLIKTRLKRK